MTDQNILVTVDIIVKRGGEVLLIQRKRDPFKGTWALPGGFIDTEEEVLTAALRELEEETSILLERHEMKFMAYFDSPDRDPRGRVISFAFLVDLELTGTGINARVKGGDDAAEARWFSIDNLPELAFDHATILKKWKE